MTQLGPSFGPPKRVHRGKYRRWHRERGHAYVVRVRVGCADWDLLDDIALLACDTSDLEGWHYVVSVHKVNRLAGIFAALGRASSLIVRPLDLGDGDA